MTDNSGARRDKNDDLQQFRRGPGERLTTNHGVPVDHTDDSLKAGERGPSLMEDFHLREKLTHFDHERIPERVVHARGVGYHGHFEVYESLSDLTKAAFLQNPGTKTPVFVRFSSVVGSRGSSDTVRDVRGFATKFYTEEGNFDLVGNNMPVFFIQDGIKFPDLVHAIKPEPQSETPQATAAHDSFWDFASLTPETTHMLMWVLSDRGIPRSYAMMEGFGVHTFRLVDAEGGSRFVKFHWRPLLGVHSLVWDETQKIAGKDPDFNRKDLFEAIEMGNYPEWELGLQVIEEADEHAFDFDLLDATKLVPEEQVPIRWVGKMTLNRNVDNFFAETEQVAFHIGNLVPGIDVTNDPLLQGRLFSYLDTQLIRLGGPNFHEIPINRPLAEQHNNQQDGYHRMSIDTARANYFPNSLGGGKPTPSPHDTHAYRHYPADVSGQKVRDRAEKFRDYFSQATLFWNTMSEPEKRHLISAAHFELGKVANYDVRHRVVHELFNNVDHDFAREVAKGIGVALPTAPGRENHGRSSPALSQENTAKDSAKLRRVAVLVAEGFDHHGVVRLQDALQQEGAQAMVVAKYMGNIASADGQQIEATMNHVTSSSVVFDGIYVPGGDHVDILKEQGDAVHFISEAFKHCKAIGATGRGIELLQNAHIGTVTVASDNDSGVVSQHGVVTHRAGGDSSFTDAFIQSLREHRHWTRGTLEEVPA